MRDFRASSGRSSKHTAILYPDIAQASAVLATFVTAFVALAPERLKNTDYASVLAAFGLPLSLFSIATGLAVLESWLSLIPFYLGLIALFLAFLLTVGQFITGGKAAPPTVPAPTAQTPGQPAAKPTVSPSQEGDPPLL